MDAATIEALRTGLGSAPGERLWHMHRRAFTALCAAGTLWRHRLAVSERGPRDLVAGLDYAGLRVVLDGLQLTLAPEDWRQLRVLEVAAVAAMNGEPG